MKRLLLILLISCTSFPPCEAIFAQMVHQEMIEMVSMKHTGSIFRQAVTVETHDCCFTSHQEVLIRDITYPRKVSKATGMIFHTVFFEHLIDVSFTITRPRKYTAQSPPDRSTYTKLIGNSQKLLS